MKQLALARTSPPSRRLIARWRGRFRRKRRNQGSRDAMGVLIAIARKTVARHTCDPRGGYWLAGHAFRAQRLRPMDLGLYPDTPAHRDA